jgi:hypothetical protein
MSPKKARKTRPKSKKRKRRRQPSPADPKERLKPISLHGMEFEEVVRRLITGPKTSNRL